MVYRYAHHEPVHTLLAFTQMETREELRIALMQLLGGMGSIDPTVLDILHSSDLPIEVGVGACVCCVGWACLQKCKSYSVEIERGMDGGGWSVRLHGM